MPSRIVYRRLIRAAARSWPCQNQRGFATAVATDHVNIVEVGPRDGLQNEKSTISLDTKLDLIRQLAATGLRTIEAGSFVSPKWTPQMANSSEILESILNRPPPAPTPIHYQFLVPNQKGVSSFLAALESSSDTSKSAASPRAGLTGQQVELSIFTAATETFTQKNTNCSIAESLQRFQPIFEAGKEKDIKVRAYISVALGCPYEGPNVDPHKVAGLAVTLLEMGAEEISVADTTGMGTAPRTRELLKTLAAAGVDVHDIALHFHDTYGQALVNTVVGLEAGVRTFDSAVAGLGGCPYSPGATGNVATEDLVHLCESLGLKTGVDMGKLAEVGEWISKQVGRTNESRAGKASLAQKRRHLDR